MPIIGPTNKFAGMPGMGAALGSGPLINPGMQPNYNPAMSVGAVTPQQGPLISSGGQPNYNSAMSIGAVTPQAATPSQFQPGMMSQRMMSQADLDAWQAQQQAAMAARQAQQMGGTRYAGAEQQAAMQQRHAYAQQAMAQRQALQDQQAARLQAMQQRQGTNVGPKERARMEEMMRRMAMQRRQLRGQLQQNRPGMLGA